MTVRLFRSPSERLKAKKMLISLKERTLCDACKKGQHTDCEPEGLNSLNLCCCTCHE